MNRFLFLFLVLWMPHASARDLDARFEQLTSVTRELPTRQSEALPVLRQAYAELEFERDLTQMDRLSTQDIDLLFRAAQSALFYSSEPNYLQQMKTAFGELQRREPPSRVQKKMMLDAFVQMRAFDEARPLAIALGIGLPAVAYSPRSDGVGVWRLQEGQLRRESLDVDQLKLLIVAHPQCGFTQRAWQQLKDDSELAPVFSDHAVWLMPQAGGVNFPAMDAWNDANPGAQMLLADDWRDWGFVEEWQTPTFIFIRNGQELGRVVGWPNGGNRTALVDAVKAWGSSP